jgi:hypothetical protein
MGVVWPPGTMARLLSGVRRREPRRSRAVAAWQTAWRLEGAEEAGKVVEKAGGGGVACPSWQPRCISDTSKTYLLSRTLLLLFLL